MLLLEEYDVELVEIEETLNINYKLVIADQILECPLCNSQIKHNHTSGVLNSGETEKIYKRLGRKLKAKKL